MTPWLLVVHFVGIVMWVGGLMIVTLVFAQHVTETSQEARASLAQLEGKLFKSMAGPGALLALLSGVGLITANAHYYLHAPWLHLKLSFVLILILLHGMAVRRFVALKQEREMPTRGSCILLHVMVSLVFLSVLISVLVGRFYLT
ncbi:MAG TPA: CopD family protein [Methylomirabilota bacterium]|nr:CopD family protein [Methylomirabilota bacterium]